MTYSQRLVPDVEVVRPAYVRSRLCEPFIQAADPHFRMYPSYRNHSQGQARQSSTRKVTVQKRHRIASFFWRLYITACLGLPVLYASHVQLSFDNVDVDATGLPWARFRTQQNQWVKSLVYHWKWIESISFLLCASALTLLQIDEIADNYVTHMFSLLCALSSVAGFIYSGLFCINRVTLRGPEFFARWLKASQNRGKVKKWEFWIFLSIPATWVAWSTIFLLVTILAYIWTPEPAMQGDIDICGVSHLGLCPVAPTVITVILGLGILHLLVIFKIFRPSSNFPDF